jgi:hypothetical protein
MLVHVRACGEEGTRHMRFPGFFGNSKIKNTQTHTKNMYKILIPKINIDFNIFLSPE